MTEIRTRQLRHLRNNMGGVDEIEILHIDRPADLGTWGDNLLLLMSEPNPFAPQDELPSLPEAMRRLARLEDRPQ